MSKTIINQSSNSFLIRSFLLILLLSASLPQSLLAVEAESLEQAKTLASQSGKPILIEFFRDG